MIKGTLFVLASTAIMTLFIYFTEKPDKNVYTFTEEQAITIYNLGVQCKQILPTSQAPAIQVTQIQNSFDSIQKIISTQYQNFHPDTTKKK